MNKIKAKKTSAKSITKQSQPPTGSRSLTELMEMFRYEMRVSFWQELALKLTLFMLSICLTIATFFIKH